MMTKQHEIRWLPDRICCSRLPPRRSPLPKHPARRRLPARLDHRVLDARTLGGRDGGALECLGVDRAAQVANAPTERVGPAGVEPANGRATSGIRSTKTLQLKSRDTVATISPSGNVESRLGRSPPRNCEDDRATVAIRQHSPTPRNLTLQLVCPLQLPVHGPAQFLEPRLARPQRLGRFLQLRALQPLDQPPLRCGAVLGTRRTQRTGRNSQRAWRSTRLQRVRPRASGTDRVAPMTRNGLLRRTTHAQHHAPSANTPRPDPCGPRRGTSAAKKNPFDNEPIEALTGRDPPHHPTRTDRATQG